MAKKIRILQLAPRFPFPTDDGGKIGIANILKEFHNQNAEVTFFCFVEPGENIPESAIHDAKQYCNLILFEHSTKNSLKRIASSFLLNHSIYINKHLSDKVKKKLDKLSAELEFDVIHADHTCMAPAALYLKKKHGFPVGLRLHNIEWLIWKRYADDLPAWHPKRLYIHQQAYLLRQYEKLALSKMDINFAITGPDKLRALELTKDAKITIASAGVNPGEWEPEAIDRNPNEIIIATTYKWVHNVKAVRWFVDKVLPIVKESIPEAFLTLIGKGAPERLNDYSDKGVKLQGYVDKVQPYLNKAAVYAAPLFVGGGIRIKILEAMAIELPVVASPVAAEGITAKPENGLLIADSEKEFADSIINLLSKPGIAKGLGQKAREYIVEEYSWQKNVGIMLKEYQRLLGRS